MTGKEIRLLVRKIFENPKGYDWSIQGLGMLRLYFGKEYRLHIWDSRFAVPGVSEMHTHPWHLRSTVVAGRLMNQRFTINADGDTYRRQMIFCGEGGGLKQQSDTVNLIASPAEFYSSGDTYFQSANEIHISRPDNGTVTFVERIMTTDPDHAYVFWRGERWVSAEPRKANPDEVGAIVAMSLAKWFEKPA